MTDMKQAATASKGADAFTLYNRAIPELVSFVREHPHSGAATHVRSIVVSLAFGKPMPLDLHKMQKSLDDGLLTHVNNAVKNKGWNMWPSDVIDDPELKEWHEIVLREFNAWGQ